MVLREPNTAYLLRRDDADMRLPPRGYEIGLGRSRTLRTYGVCVYGGLPSLIVFSSFSVGPSEGECIARRARRHPPLRQGSEACRDLILRPRLTVAVLAGVLPALADYIEGGI